MWLLGTRFAGASEEEKEGHSRELTRCRGHIIVWEKGIHDGKDALRVSSGISTRADRVSPVGRTAEELAQERENAGVEPSSPMRI